MTNGSFSTFSSENFGMRLRNARKAKGFGQKDLAKEIGVTQVTVLNWEKGASVPDIKTLINLCAALGVTVATLLADISPELLGTEAHMTAREIKLLNDLRMLPEKEQLLAESILSTMAQAEKAEQEQNGRSEKQRREYLLASYMPMQVQSTAAAAGYGNIFGDCECERIFVHLTPENRRADTIIHVDGKSMEPSYPDGCDVYVQFTSFADCGDDVVASTDDGAVIKRVGEENGMRILYSVNTNIPFPEKYEDDNVTILGKVLGIVREGDRASDEDLPELRELFPENSEK